MSDKSRDFASIVVIGPVQCGKSFVGLAITEALKEKLGIELKSTNLTKTDLNCSLTDLEDWEQELLDDTDWHLTEVSEPRKSDYDTHKLDTQTSVFFYEQEFYVLSNFSSFRVKWNHIDFDTSEHAYHWAKFCETDSEIAEQILNARSAHDAFQIAQDNKSKRDPLWDENKEEIMFDILQAKVSQHEYVRRKLLETGDRQLIEDSWRDSFWGSGPDGTGYNVLGNMWMGIRDAIREGKEYIGYIRKPDRGC